MTNEPIDWTQPICLDTVPPKPATVRWVYPDGSGADVYADWFGNGCEDWQPTDNEGFIERHLPRVRNVRTGDFEPAPDLAAELAEALRAAECELERAREQFAFYAESHRQKQTADGDEKAKTNYRFAGYMTAGRDIARAALAKWDARK